MRGSLYYEKGGTIKSDPMEMNDCNGKLFADKNGRVN